MRFRQINIHGVACIPARIKTNKISLFLEMDEDCDANVVQCRIVSIPA